jgi:two-component system, OmpR family, sensor kinase
VSLRARLLVGMALVAVVLVSVAVVVARSAEAYLIGQIDDELAPAGEFAGGGRGHDGPTQPGADPGTGEDDGTGGDGTADDQGARFGPSPYYVGVVDGDTIVTLRMPDVSAGAADEDVPVPDIDAAEARAAADGEGGGDATFTVGSSDPDVRYRVRAHTDSDGDVVVVATSLADVDAAVDRLVAVEAAGALAALAILGLVTFWVLRLGLRPLKAMTHTATEIAAGDLSHRVPSAPDGTEAAELGAALNTMLARIEDSFAQRQASEERLRRFVADASHELRTPVTTIRGYAELHRRGALDDPDELAQAMRRTEDEANRMATLVDDLLLLARLDQGRPLARGPVDLGVLAIDAASDARAVAPERTVRAVTDEDTVVVGDEHRLRQVLANLVRNALVHTPPAATITVAARRNGDRAVVEVADDGPGMTVEQASRAFERFYRADAGRSRDRGGTGLGLAIVRAVAAAHGGQATLTSAPGAGTTVRVDLPLASADAHAT